MSFKIEGEIIEEPFYHIGDILYFEGNKHHNMQSCIAKIISSNNNYFTVKDINDGGEHIIYHTENKPKLVPLKNDDVITEGEEVVCINEYVPNNLGKKYNIRQNNIYKSYIRDCKDGWDYEKSHFARLVYPEKKVLPTTIEVLEVAGQNLFKKIMGESEMNAEDIKGFNKENLKEAKKQVLEEKASAEVRQAKEYYQKLIDRKEMLERIQNQNNKDLEEVEKEIKEFDRK